MSRTDQERPVIDLDGPWQFTPDPESRIAEPGELASRRTVAVPGCWEADENGGRGITTAWYRRTIDIPEDWHGARVVLAFGAVMYHAVVFLNGHRLGEHEGGYTSFEQDATHAIAAGLANEIAVRVVNPLAALDAFPADAAQIVAADARVPAFPASGVPHGKQTWYSSQSGIWQSVRIERRPRPSLRPLRVRTRLRDPAATVRWALDVTDAPPTSGRRIDLTILDPDGRAAGEGSVDLDRDATSGEVAIRIGDPRPWGIGEPNLYCVEARLVVDGMTHDRIDARFGFREIATRDGRILLNGRPIYLLGALDQDLYDGTISTPPSRAMLDDQIRRAREMGLNLLRCHIKVPDPAYLDAADEAGILVWAELPNWATFSAESARRGRETLTSMVETLGNHPSIVIWTIINEDWGTRVREEARDRAWLAETYDWLKHLDPDRLVVDNSACDTASTPNFHVRSDLADFHVYHGAPDNAARWQSRIADFARRPTWLWSPFGDAQPRGDEPLVLSEFGSWALPRLAPIARADKPPPWWFDTGRDHLRPMGIRTRFEEYGLDRVWPTLDDLAVETQRHQFETLQYEIGDLRRHDTIQGYVITELADAYWEANGLLDVARRPKAAHDRLGTINAPDVVIVDMPRRDLLPGGPIAATVHLGSYGTASDGGEVRWRVASGDAAAIVSGRWPVVEWPDGGARCIGEIDASLPATTPTGDAELIVEAVDETGATRATDRIRLAILPSSSSRTVRPLTIDVRDPVPGARLADRVGALGHHIIGAAPKARDLIVASQIDDDALHDLQDGGRALILVRSRSALPGARLDRPVVARARSLPDPTAPDRRSRWDGDWVTTWSWILPGAFRGLPMRNPLDFAYREVMPDHVLDGYEPRKHRDEVIAGIFSGWVHAPAALVWQFPQGRGVLTLTTFRVAPECGPLATALLEGLLQLAAGQPAVDAGTR